MSIKKPPEQKQRLLKKFCKVLIKQPYGNPNKS